MLSMDWGQLGRPTILKSDTTDVLTWLSYASETSAPKDVPNCAEKVLKRQNVMKFDVIRTVQRNAHARLQPHTSTHW